MQALRLPPTAGVRRSSAIWVVLLTLTSGCNPPPPSPEAEATGPPFFRDVTDESGVRAAYRNGEESGDYTILETLGGGIALFDYDGDGRLDLFVAGGGYFANQQVHGHPSYLFRNLGGFHFQDVTRQVGLDLPLFYTHGCAVADYDCDGWPDLLVTGYGRLALYHNEADGHGGRRFVEKTKAAGLCGELWSTSAAWADLDGDGYPDLYVCHYVDWSLTGNNPHCVSLDGSKRRDICPPQHFNPLPHVLYHNQQNGTFRDVSKEAGLRLGPNPKDLGRGLGVIAVDIDDDTKPDLYVANDMNNKFLYVNRSQPGRIRLKEIGLAAGVACDDQGLPNGSMGLAVADYDNCGRPSLWVTNYERELHGLYHNDSENGRPSFRFISKQAGIGALGQSYVGWGTGFLDLDHDGREHLVFVNGHPNYYPESGGQRQQRPVLLHNDGGGHFKAITARGGSYFQESHNGRGLALGDLDNDGRTDLVISHLNAPVALLRNETLTKSHWLGVSLVGRKNRDVAGARITLQVGDRRLTRFAAGGGSYLSCNDRRIIFGLGDAERVGRLTVSWPWGREEHWDDLDLDRYIKLEEGVRSAISEPRP